MSRGRERTRLVAAALCIGYRLLAAAVLALPASLAVARLLGRHPDGDAALFAPGGVWLLESARLVGPSLRAHAGAALAVLLATSVGWLLPLGMLTAAYAPRHGGGLPRAWGRARRSVGRLVLLWGICSLGQAATVTLCCLLGRHTLGALASPALGWAAGAVAGAILAAGLALVHELTRTEVVWRGRGLYDAIEAALGACRARLGRLLLAAGWRTAVAVAVVALAGLMPWGPAAPALLVTASIAVVHVALRASWLGLLARLDGA
jgi:hypothetical protein